MSSNLEVLEGEALKLEPADRSHLLERLIASLDSDPAPDKPQKATLAALAAALESMKDWASVAEPFPDVDAGLLPLDTNIISDMMAGADTEFARVPGLRLQKGAIQ